MMHLLTFYVNYNPSLKKIIIGGCEITPKLDFNASKYDLVYDNIVLVGKSVCGKDVVEEEPETYDNPAKTKQKSFWTKLKNWF